MDKIKIEKLLKGKEISLQDIYALPEELRSNKNYLKWMLTAPVSLDFELCRTEKANLSLCSALLTAILREDYFSNGSFEERLESGVIENILHRITEVADEQIEENPPWFSLNELWKEHCAQVPKKPGIYYVILPDGEPRLREDPRGGYDPEDLKKRWKKSGGKCLYIGKAAGKRGGLRTRLWQYMRCGYANGKNHRGGRAIWQVEQQSELRIFWQVCREANELECKLLRRYQEVFDGYPMANRRS